MREIRLSGSEGGARSSILAPTPYQDVAVIARLIFRFAFWSAAVLRRFSRSRPARLCKKRYSGQGDLNHSKNASLFGRRSISRLHALRSC